MKKWEKCYGVLDDGELVVYNKRHGNVKASMELDGQTRVKRAENVRVNCIHVHKTKKEQMYLQAPDDASFAKWFRGLRQHVHYAKHRAGAPAAAESSSGSDDE